MSGAEYGMQGGDSCYVDFFREERLAHLVMPKRHMIVALDGEFELSDLKKLVREFERRRAALSPHLRERLGLGRAAVLATGQWWADDSGPAEVMAVLSHHCVLRRQGRTNPFIQSIGILLEGRHGWHQLPEEPR